MTYGRDKAEGRRNFLRLMIAAGSAATLIAGARVFRLLGYVPPPSGAGGTAQLSWPRVKLMNTTLLQPLKPVRFNYPLVNTPNLLVKLGVSAENGVGPDGDIVAYSAICQHLGCYFGFQAPNTSPPCNSSIKTSTAEGYCCCHGGEYDFVHTGKVIGGPPPRPIPAVKLDYDTASGDIYAVGMGSPAIFGHGTPGATDPDLVLKYDLEGGRVVTQDTVFSEG
jgi:arsenite oxidase small subunit